MICPQRTAEIEDDTTTTTAATEGIDKMDLQDSVLTTPTDTGSVSEDDNNNDGGGVGHWLLGGISSDFRTLAKSLKEKAGGVAGGVADIFQRLYGPDDEHDELDAQLHLPWEIRHHHDQDQEHGVNDQNNNHDGEENGQQEPKNVVLYEEDLVLKEKIHALSAKEDTFLKPFTADMVATEERFLDKPRIELVNRILQVDEQLRSTHARLSGRSNVQETMFWRNYFYHCSETRKIHLHMYHQEVRDDESESSSSLVPANTDDDEDDDGDNNHLQQESADDSSFFHVPSPPASTGMLSVDSMIFVGEMD